jgi:predicted RNase H-like nuclease (RuvC/YqgF family)
VVQCFTYETADISYCREQAEKEMSANEYIWETFDGLFKTVHRQERRAEELEARIAELERRLDETSQADQQLTSVRELPVERAA